jgi:hypothetical protein
LLEIVGRRALQGIGHLSTPPTSDSARTDPWDAEVGELFQFLNIFGFFTLPIPDKGTLFRPTCGGKDTAPF